MTIKITRAAFAALMLATSSIALSDFALAQDRSRNETDGSRAGRQRSDTPAKAPTGPTVSSGFGRAMGPVQRLIGEKKFPEALAALKEAQSTATSDYDKLIYNRFLTVVAINLSDEATASNAAMAAADLPEAAIPETDRNEVYSNATALAINAKQNEKAAGYARHMIALGMNDARSQQLINTAMYTGAPPAEAIAYFQKQLDAAAAAGQRPSRDVVDMKINLHLKANDNASAEATLEQALLIFNDPKDWDQIINVTMTTRGIRDIDAVNLGRLLYATGFPVSKDNADLIGQTSQKLAMYGDAQASQQKGATLQLDTARINADKASMPEQIKLGAAQNGVYNVKLSEALYGYGMYPQAEATARAALAKGGIDNSEAQMLIAMSLYQQGNLPGAATAFEQVQGGSAATPRIARLWGTFIKIKQNPPAATAAAAPAAPAAPR